METQALQLYGFLPEGKQELRRMRNNAKRTSGWEVSVALPVKWSLHIGRC